MATTSTSFKKGQSGNPNGRHKGQPNKSTQLLKDAILQAAEIVGRDGKGKDGLVGYLVRVAKEDVKAFSSLLGKVLPTQITGEGDGPLQIKLIRTIVKPSD